MFGAPATVMVVPWMADSLAASVAVLVIAAAMPANAVPGTRSTLPVSSSRTTSCNGRRVASAAATPVSDVMSTSWILFVVSCAVVRRSANSKMCARSASEPVPESDT